jgi:CO/xanthine dehydrogenase Mo-binding subunit
VVKEAVDLPGIMDRALAAMDYRARREAHAAHNATDDPVKKGVGFAVFMHGCGFTGGGEAYLASVAGVEGTPEGKVRVLAASTEIGQGTNTMFSQVVAEALRIPADLVEVQQPDTKLVPNSGPTVASRTCMVVGKLVQDAAVGLKQAVVQAGLLKEPYTRDDFQAAVAAYVAAFGSLKAYSQYSTPPHIVWSDETYRGDAYGTYAWACYAADVAVDTRTCEVAVNDFVALQEVGRVINPTLAAGQIEGGVAQGIGWALWEKVEWREGRMANAQMTNYIMATSADLPRLRVLFEENPNPLGPSGAKGIGELPMDGPAPAILNAIQQALGTDAPTEIPLTPELLLDTLEAAHA